MIKCNLSINIKIYNNNYVNSRLSKEIFPCTLAKNFIIWNVSYYYRECIEQRNAAKCWKVPDSLGIENTGALDDLKL